jgi:hypothetical protein
MVQVQVNHSNHLETTLLKTMVGTLQDMGNRVQDQTHPTLISRVVDSNLLQMDINLEDHLHRDHQCKVSGGINSSSSSSVHLRDTDKEGHRANNSVHHLNSNRVDSRDIPKADLLPINRSLLHSGYRMRVQLILGHTQVLMEDFK